MIPFLRGVDVRRKLRKKKEKLFFQQKKKREENLWLVPVFENKRFGILFKCSCYKNLGFYMFFKIKKKS